MKLVCYFAITVPWNFLAHEVKQQGTGPNEIDLDVVVYRQCRTPFVIQLLLLNNKNCLKLKASF